MLQILEHRTVWPPLRNRTLPSVRAMHLRSGSSSWPSALLPVEYHQGEGRPEERARQHVEGIVHADGDSGEAPTDRCQTSKKINFNVLSALFYL